MYLVILNKRNTMAQKTLKENDLEKIAYNLEEREYSRFFFCQLEAIETLIWLTEAPDSEKFGIDIPSDGGEIKRLCSKMATGSGKTIVAVLAASIVIDSGYQVAFMVPTEILARQHYEKIMSEIKQVKYKQFGKNKVKCARYFNENRLMKNKLRKFKKYTIGKFCKLSDEVKEKMLSDLKDLHYKKHQEHILIK